MATPRIAESVGRVLGDRYRLIRPLGTGASAHVYVAEDVSLRRRVAIKVLHPALAGDEAFLRRFRAEAQVVAALRHPNILRVYDWGQDGDAPYLVMELLEGGNLRSLLDRGQLLSPAQAASVGAEAARGLEYAHRRGLVHRDIKPANLIFDDEGRISVADFGLARALAEATWTEPAGAVVGTARYAAPEQVRGQPLDSRADVYSLALVLVEATTGRVPFATDTTLGTLMARLERDLPVLDELGALGPVVAAAGTADPASRLEAVDFARSLDGAASKLPPPAPLPLAIPLVSGETEIDDQPTEYPGKAKLFDGAAIETPAHSGSGVVAGAGRRGGAGALEDLPPDPDQSHLLDGPTGHDAGEDPSGAPAVPRKRRRKLRILAILLAVLLLGGGGAAAALVATGSLTPSHPVPALVGADQQKAQQLLYRLHMKLAVYGRSYSDRAVGTVLAQRPDHGRLAEGSTVSVLLSLGPQPVKVPADLAGKPQADAADVLQALGLKVGHVTYKPDMTVPAGDVLSSSPSSGTLLPGQAVDLVVSNGKPTVAVPTLNGASAASFAAARAALAQVGLGAVENDRFSNTVPQGQVIGTQPPPGTTLTVGTQVTVVVSKGPDLVAVPNVTGDTVPQATQILYSYGFSVTVNNAGANAHVTSTNPAPGTQIVRGSNVTILTG